MFRASRTMHVNRCFGPKPRVPGSFTNRGVIRELYFRADREAAVLVLECENVAEAQHHLASLPLVKAGLIAFDVIPLKAYPGFARLFSPP